MFGIFFTPYIPFENEANRKDIEHKICKLISLFGIERIRKQPFLLPDGQTFPHNQLLNKESLAKLIEQVCGIMDIDPELLVFKFYDDLKSLAAPWDMGSVKYPIGTFSQFLWSDKKYLIRLASSLLGNFNLFLSTLVHELSHVKMIGQRGMQNDEELTDYAVLYFGFGIMSANSFFIHNYGQSGYLNARQIAYANALICHISGKDPKNFQNLFNGNSRGLFKKNINWLQKNANDELAQQLNNAEALYQSDKQKTALIFSRADTENFRADGILTQQIQFKKTDRELSILNNNIGYALLQRKKYSAAIPEFEKAIVLDRFFDFPYNNRAYCLLQLGDLKAAFQNLSKAMSLNPDNPFIWRNFGHYYLLKDMPEKALTMLQLAYACYNSTELIHFYLGHCYLKLQNLPEAKKHFEYSISNNEYNYSNFQDIDPQCL